MSLPDARPDPAEPEFPTPDDPGIDPTTFPDAEPDRPILTPLTEPEPEQGPTGD